MFPLNLEKAVFKLIQTLTSKLQFKDTLKAFDDFKNKQQECIK